jgi:hypothetical protein
MKANSKRKRRSSKPAIDRPPKPYDGFPLCAANCGAWQKKIKAKIHYFGKWGHVVKGKLVRIDEEGNWRPTLEKFEQQQDALYAGRVPPDPNAPDTVTIKNLCDQFLTAKLRKIERGEMSAKSFIDHRTITDLLVAVFGKNTPLDDLRPADFEKLLGVMAKRWGLVRRCNAIVGVRGVFKYGVANRLSKEPNFESEFKKPDKGKLREQRNQNGKRLFEAADIRALLAKASPQVKAMILLGIRRPAIR